MTRAHVINATQAGARVHVAEPRGLACHLASTWACALEPIFLLFIIIIFIIL